MNNDEYCPSCECDQPFTVTSNGMVEQDGQHNDDIVSEHECNQCGYTYESI